MTHWTECLCIILDEKDVERRKARFLGNELPLIGDVKVGDVIKIPIPPDRYFISKEPAVILDKKAARRPVNE